MGRRSAHPGAPIADDTAIALWGDVIRGFSSANSRLHRAIRDAFSLTPAEAEALINLRAEPDGRAPLSALSRAAQFTSGGFTKVAERLCARGLATRVPSETDRRVVYLELTAQGREVADEVACLVARINRDQFVDVLGEERAHDVAGAMREIYEDQQTRSR